LVIQKNLAHTPSASSAKHFSAMGRGISHFSGGNIGRNNELVAYQNGTHSATAPEITSG
jgi:hypothetical protein